MTKRIHSVLLTDDDPDDRFLFEEALLSADPNITYDSAVDGLDAIDKLSQGNIPDVIFMDVNMPRMNGIACLKELRQIPTLREIPVIMYSTSSYYRDECFRLGANAYIEKPSDFAKLCEKLRTITSNGLPLKDVN